MLQSPIHMQSLWFGCHDYCAVVVTDDKSIPNIIGRYGGIEKYVWGLTAKSQFSQCCDLHNLNACLMPFPPTAGFNSTCVARLPMCNHFLRSGANYCHIWFWSCEAVVWLLYMYSTLHMDLLQYIAVANPFSRILLNSSLTVTFWRDSLIVKLE